MIDVTKFFVIIINIILSFFRITRILRFSNYTKNNILISDKDLDYSCKVRKIATWNVNGIFILLNFNKIIEIIKSINNINADLICLQECFDNNMKHCIINNLKVKYPYHLSGSLKKRMIIGEDSGLLVLSKLPIEYVKFHSFKNSCGIDGWFSNKGVLYFCVDGTNYANTHTQSEDLSFCDMNYENNPSTTKKQIYEIIANSPFGFNFILMGDLNNTYVCELVNAKQNNDGFTYIDNEKCFDYILPLSNDKDVTDVSVLKIKDNPSDHLPVIGYV